MTSVHVRWMREYEICTREMDERNMKSVHVKWMREYDICTREMDERI